jgi:hypothetical protein
MAKYELVTLEELKDQLTEKLGANSTFWLDEEKRFAINEALRIWQLFTGEFTTSFTIGGDGETIRDVPRQLVATQRMTFNEIPLGLISVWELDGGMPGWESEVGTPQFWAPIGFNKIALYPTPIVGDLKFEGIAEAPRLVGDGDYIPLGKEEIILIVDYAHHYCTFKEGSGEQESALPVMRRFVEGAVLRNARLRTSAWYRTFMGLPRDEDQRPPRRQGGVGRG